MNQNTKMYNIFPMHQLSFSKAHTTAFLFSPILDNIIANMDIRVSGF